MEENELWRKMEWDFRRIKALTGKTTRSLRYFVDILVYELFLYCFSGKNKLAPLRICLATLFISGKYWTFVLILTWINVHLFFPFGDILISFGPPGDVWNFFSIDRYCPVVTVVFNESFTRKDAVYVFKTVKNFDAKQNATTTHKHRKYAFTVLKIFSRGEMTRTQRRRPTFPVVPMRLRFRVKQIFQILLYEDIKLETFTYYNYK